MAIKNTSIDSVAPTQIFNAIGQQAITTILFCNVSTSTTTLNVFMVPFGSNPGIQTQVIREVIIPAAETFVMDTERFILEDNDGIFAQASITDAITSTVSSVNT